MSELRLVAPDPRHHGSYLGALHELAGEGNAYFLELVVPAERDFAGVRYDEPALRDPDVFAEFCAYSRGFADGSSPHPAAWVGATYLWMLVEDQIVGRISLRHELTPWLREVGGHIGYAVRPSARRRGHATAALRQMLRVAADRGLDPVLVTCDADNLGSRRVIEACGGVLEDQRGLKLRFWIRTAAA